MENYNYSISGDFSAGCNSDCLQFEIIENETIVKTLLGININADNCDIGFDTALSTEEGTELDAVVAAHLGLELPDYTCSGLIQWSDGNSHAGSLTGYMSEHRLQASEAIAQYKMPKSTVKKIKVYISSNTLTSNSTITLRKNGVNTSLTFVIESEQTGWIEATDEVLFDENDLLSVSVALGADGEQSIDFEVGLIEYKQ